MAETVETPTPPVDDSNVEGKVNPKKKREAAVTAAKITGACAIVAALIVGGVNYVNNVPKSAGDAASDRGTTITSGPAAVPTRITPVAPPVVSPVVPTVLFREISDNGAGTRVFSTPEGAPVSSTVRSRIPMRDEVQVRCVVMGSSMPSVTGMYLIVGGEWDGLYAVTDSFANGDKVGDPSGSTAVDPRVPAC